MLPAEGGRSGHSLDLESISHSFGSVKVVDDVSLPIEAGELVALLGPSGCGKTTLLRIIGGFVAQNAGRVRVDGGPIDNLPANRRDIGIVFQNYALFPHMTVTENVAYGLRARGAPRALIRERVDRMLAVVQRTLCAGTARSSTRRHRRRFDVRTAAVSGVLIATTALFVFVMDRLAGLTRRLT